MLRVEIYYAGLEEKESTYYRLWFGWQSCFCSSKEEWETSETQQQILTYNMPFTSDVEKAAKWGKVKHFFFDKIKNIAGQVLTYNSKNFHWLNRKTRPRIDYEWIQKNILRKSEQKNKKKNRKSISKCRMWTKKPLARNENLIQTKK